MNISFKGGNSATPKMFAELEYIKNTDTANINKYVKTLLKSGAEVEPQTDRDIAAWTDKRFLDSLRCKLKLIGGKKSTQYIDTAPLSQAPIKDTVSISRSAYVRVAEAEAAKLPEGVKVYEEARYEGKPESQKLGKCRKLIVAEFVDENGLLNRVEYEKKRNGKVKQVAHFVLHKENDNAFVQVPVGESVDSPKRIGIRIDTSADQFGNRTETLWRHNRFTDSFDESIQKTSRSEVKGNEPVLDSVIENLRSTTRT